nr:sigma-54 dependent transcriptional regulator [uncultured Rhodopila sp.]
MKHEITVPSQGLKSSETFARLNLLGESRAFLGALRRIERIAEVDAGVLILGETGTGKELAARALHYLSPRRDFGFVPVNCGALPDSLLESELFGHEQGAFTDAKRANRGLIAQAEGGTLFFDEIETMTLRAQVVLLRFLQDHQYRPVGGHLMRPANIRVIAATNADMEQMVRRGEFRSDLLFRFGVLRVTMPALRDREDDAVLITKYFRSRFAAQYRRPASPLDPGMIARLRAYNWPGNVREVENFALQQILLDDSACIEIGAWAGTAAATDSAAADPALCFRSAKAIAVAQFERNYIRRLLDMTGGNVSEAAKICGKDRSTLNKLVRKHGIGG